MKIQGVKETEIVIPLHKPSLKEKLFFCTSGMVVSIPITLFANMFSRHLCVLLPLFFSAVCSSAIFAPIIEEFAKAYPLFYRHGETEKSMFLLGFLAGLGFGITEFFLYVFVLDAPLYFRIPAIFFHASSTSITAYGIATKQPLAFYLIAVLLHVSNNFFTFSEPIWLIAGPAILIITYSLSWHFYRRTSDRIVY